LHTYWLVGAVTALLFFLSILVHELGHSWVALRAGIAIRSITLFVFGGIARVAGEPSAPGAEFRIAIAGPLTSLALAAGFGAVQYLTSESVVLTAAVTWLARMNLMVAVFNLLPGFPLDGGRVLRAVMWRWTGSFQGATRSAARAGKVLAVGFIALGALTALRGNVLGGIWMALIGWFLQNAALATAAESTLRELLRGVTVDQAMSRECQRVARGLSLDRLVEEEIIGRGRHCFVVTDDGRLQGLLTLQDVKAVPRAEWPRRTVGDVMAPAHRLLTVTPREELLGALKKMDDARVGQMPVLSNGDLVGMLGREQVLHYVRVRTELGTT
jgi:Zn-dependent protease/CBS domain-containing protein